MSAVEFPAGSDKVESHRSDPDRALRVLEELACMSRAKVPWTRGLASLSRSEDRRLAALSKQLVQQLDQGMRPSELVRTIDPKSSTALLSLLRVAEVSDRPNEVLEGLVAVFREELHRQRRWRNAILSTIASLIAAVLVLGLSLYVMISQPDFIGVSLPHSEVVYDQVHVPRLWYIPMVVGFLLPGLLLFIVSVTRSLHPRYWGRIGWFVELLQLQLKQGGTLPEACERAAHAALMKTDLETVETWVAAWRGGKIPHAEKGTLDVVRWTLVQPRTNLQDLHIALEKLSKTFMGRAHRLAWQWERLLPGILLFSCIFGLMISFVLLTIYPVYALVV